MLQNSYPATGIKQIVSLSVVEKKSTVYDVRIHFGPQIFLDVAGVTTFIACSSLLILVVVVAIVVIGIDPTISGSMAIPLAFSTLGCTLPSMVVIALGAQR
ncbi:hypothetical protein Tco_0922353 [Tanacetum coccineum]|uniref:Uncharacterized protein n=1 Tax=Tanacetum coccineum TaxID=301880 RepID=A0ABQ5D4B6_9ASTR